MAVVGTGATITFDTGFFAEIISIDGPGVSRPAIDATHMGTTTAREWIPGSLYDPGTADIEIAFAPETTPAYAGAAETVTFTFTSAGAGGTTTWAASGFLTNFSPSIPLEERMTATATLQLSGAITITP